MSGILPFWEVQDALPGISGRLWREDAFPGIDGRRRWRIVWHGGILAGPRGRCNRPVVRIVRPAGGGVIVTGGTA
jgi:hypothetical protein